METKSKSIASRTRLKEPILIHCNIGETLTPNSCSKIVTEISKYIICNNLIPYHFDTLKKAAENFKLVSSKVMVCFDVRICLSLMSQVTFASRIEVQISQR
jgi:hypothetical protein